MATYTYKCSQCMREKDVKHSMHDEPKIMCDKCKSDVPMDVVIKAPPVLFKGNNWPGRQDYQCH